MTQEEKRYYEIGEASYEWVGERGDTEFRLGAEWAVEREREHLINKACDWLIDNIFDYLKDVSHFNGTWDIDTQTLIPDFRKYMEEQHEHQENK